MHDTGVSGRAVVLLTVILLTVLVGGPPVRAADGQDRIERAQAMAERLLSSPRALRLRARHLRVIHAWDRAIEGANHPRLRMRAMRGQAEAWALLAHWSGRSRDSEKADALLAALEEQVVLPPPTDRARAPRSSDSPSASVRSGEPRRPPALAAIVAEVRRAYPDVALLDEPVAGERAKRALTIVVDPGHGGRDRGAAGVRGLIEKDITLALARRLGDALRTELGAKVIYTRTRDRFVSLSERVRLANRARADLYISVHANAHRQADVHGIETFYFEGPRSMAREFARRVQSGMMHAVRSHRFGVKSLGIKAARFRVLRGVRMPAVLVEAGFITHSSEARRLSSDAYRETIVEGIVRGVRSFVDSSSRVDDARRAELSVRARDINDECAHPEA